MLRHDFLPLCTDAQASRAEGKAIVCIAAGVNFVILAEGYLNILTGFPGAARRQASVFPKSLK
ncbi:hypothetical protein [Erwinia pyrifoliae]|uniref:hypothetical protein n=1 Tax=Erwinia pyrifoliae TaxID=79967 RepID=UPI0001961477|nr:hypothetical protein [Erwinia pyrifoliae]AUX71653.1 hypothetical protein CPI84_03595 [Erwinia pyrifoliae]MCA8878122.1 hypothetical protein [Erwinia pyrifoliae]CAX56730.1 uncharacterized protein EpC_29510 [Erwinia pyrifoliae Ep1/96]CAY75571.1 hypothetical protein EPYR_03191 [Erwinia pyrifoliae DSM 12163]